MFHDITIDSAWRKHPLLRETSIRSFFEILQFSFIIYPDGEK